MEINFDNKKDGTSAVELTFEPKEVESQRRRTFNKLRNSIRIDGFRKGKISYKTFQKMFGEDLIEASLLDDIVNNNFYNYIKEEDINPVSQPKMTTHEFDENGGLTAKIEFAVLPEIEIPEVNNFFSDEDNLVYIDNSEKTYSDEDINELLLDFYDTNPVEREVQDDDLVLLETIDTNNLSYVPKTFKAIIGKNNPYIKPELLNNLIGKKKGKLARLKDGDLYYDVKIQDIAEYSAPELTDEFVKETFDFDTVDEFKEFTNSIIEKNKLAETVRESGESLFQKIINTDLEISPLYIEQLKEDYGELASELPNYDASFSKENSVEENLEKLVKEDLISEEMSGEIDPYSPGMMLHYLMSHNTKAGRALDNSKENEKLFFYRLNNLDFRRNALKNVLGQISLRVKEDTSKESDD